MTEQHQELVWLNNSAAISVRLSEFPANSGQMGIDIRKYISGERYTGFTKKGIWIPVETYSGAPLFFDVLKACIEVFADFKGVGVPTLCQRIAKDFVKEVTLDESKENTT